MGYETKFTFEENPEMYAAEYLARHFTEGNDRKEEEPVMYEVLELIEDHDSLDKVIQGLDCPISQAYFFEVMAAEIKWCEETLSTALNNTDAYKEVSVLKEAYEIAVNYMQELSTL